MSGPYLAFVESNTTGTGRHYCRRARDFGLTPMLFTRDPHRYSYVDTDRIQHRIIDTSDPRTVLAHVRALNGPVAAVASSSEYFVATAGEVAAALGLPHPDPDAVRACRDKGRQRATLHAAGLPGAAFQVARTPGEAVAAAKRIGYPVVVKPAAGSGSVATVMCFGLAEVRDAASAVLDADPATLGLPRQDAVLIEEFLDGPEFSVETLGMQVVGVTAKHLGPRPHFVEIGHDFPAALLPSQRAAIEGTALAALQALGLGWGAAHVELRLTGSGPRLIEVNPRLAGGMIPRMVEAALGIDLVGHAVAIAAGIDLPLRPRHLRSAAIRFVLAQRSGTFTEVSGLQAARSMPGVVEAELTTPLGTRVQLRYCFTDRLGYVIAADDGGNVAARAAEAAALAVRAYVAPASLVAEGGSR